MNQLTICESEYPPEGASMHPPQNLHFPPPPWEPDRQLANERMTLDEGPVMLQWPVELKKESVEELEYWLKGVLRRARRKAGLSPEPEREST
jgi:hypothetical protein